MRTKAMGSTEDSVPEEGANVFAVVVIQDGETRGFNVWLKGSEWEVMEVPLSWFGENRLVAAFQGSVQSFGWIRHGTPNPRALPLARHC